GSAHAAEPGRRDVAAKARFGDLVEEMGDGLWHRDVAERHEAPAPVDAPGDQEAAAAPADVAERGDDPGAGAVVISRLDDPLGSVHADHEGDAGQDTRLLAKGRRAGQLDGSEAVQLLEPAADVAGPKRGLVGVRDGELERNRLSHDLTRDARELEMAGVQRVERPGEPAAWNGSGGLELAVGTHGQTFDGACEERGDGIG